MCNWLPLSGADHPIYKALIGSQLRVTEAHIRIEEGTVVAAAEFEEPTSKLCTWSSPLTRTTDGRDLFGLLRDYFGPDSMPAQNPTPPRAGAKTK